MFHLYLFVMYANYNGQYKELYQNSEFICILLRIVKDECFPWSLFYRFDFNANNRNTLYLASHRRNGQTQKKIPNIYTYKTKKKHIIFEGKRKYQLIQINFSKYILGIKLPTVMSVILIR